MAPRRIVRVPVYHWTIFEYLVAGARRAEGTLRSHGYEWRLAHQQEGVEIYERSDFGLAWLRSSVSDYERALYELLAGGVVNGDGYVRLRTMHVVKGRRGAYARHESRISARW
jgi:hypothetical protein